MKVKTIKAVLRKKIDEWLDSIEDENVRKLARRDTIVTGGAIASMLLQEDVNDFDIYFSTRETTLAVANYYVGRFAPEKKRGIDCKIVLTNGYGHEITAGSDLAKDLPSDDERHNRIKIKIKSAGIASEEGTDKPYEYFESRPEGEAAGYVSSIITNPGEIEDVYQETEQLAQQTVDDGKPKYRPVFLSTNAITLSHKIQIVIRFYGEPDKLHENYDFVHCTNYWTSHDSKLTLRQAALEALLSRELRYVGSKYPVCSIIRLRKFIKRNWTINAGQILKMCMQISDLDLTNVNVLEDQLTGVDSSYFLQVISALKEKDPVKIDCAYLVEVIDRLF